MKSRLLDREAAPNNIVDSTNSPDMKPNMPIVKNRPVMISLYKFCDLFMVESLTGYSRLIIEDDLTI